MCTWCSGRRLWTRSSVWELAYAVYSALTAGKSYAEAFKVVRSLLQGDLDKNHRGTKINCLRILPAADGEQTGALAEEETPTETAADPAVQESSAISQETGERAVSPEEDFVDTMEARSRLLRMMLWPPQHGTAPIPHELGSTTTLRGELDDRYALQSEEWTEVAFAAGQWSVSGATGSTAGPVRH